ncbi:hypothetical protein K2173_011987 [Erythroxylum novogranatense]|uniref:Uncharacterized protein n=1 Tax=Erythroxylum novogranatense TaxID=1862640 RepID=A0AAV8TG99_9ROSI|nr:hypothetical protein K2173_011987 [Erythroxylum novogranatense]
MGACATKPKVAKDNEGKAPVPPPETVKEEVAAEVKKEEVTGVAEEEKKVVEREVGDQGHGKVKDVDDDHKVDDDSSKRRSLSNLFKEKEGEKQIPEADNKPVEQVKQETVETGKVTEPLPQEPLIVTTEEPLVAPKPADESSLTQKLVEELLLTENDKSVDPVKKRDVSLNQGFVEAPEVLPKEKKPDIPLESIPIKAEEVKVEETGRDHSRSDQTH